MDNGIKSSLGEKKGIVLHFGDVTAIIRPIQQMLSYFITADSLVCNPPSTEGFSFLAICVRGWYYGITCLNKMLYIEEIHIHYCFFKM